jgi:hypothetical protein
VFTPLFWGSFQHQMLNKSNKKLIIKLLAPSLQPKTIFKVELL